MRRRTPLEVDHSKINWGVRQILKIGEVCGIEVQFKLADRMAERNLTVRELAEITGLRLATISDVMNGNRSSMNFQHLIVIMMALRLEKLSDLVDVHFPEHLADYYAKQSKEWVELHEPPFEIYQYKLCNSVKEEHQELYEQSIKAKFEEIKDKYGKLKNQQK